MRAGSSPIFVTEPISLANAIANAIGVQIFELPITPEKVLKAIRSKTENSIPDHKN